MEHTDTFTLHDSPMPVVVEVPTNTLLADAALQAGLDIGQPCGGQGRCGRCAVQVIDGAVRRRSTLRLSPSDVGSGYALACQTVVEGDVRIYVPPQEKIERRLTTDRVVAEVSVPADYDYNSYQTVKRFTLQLTPRMTSWACSKFAIENGAEPVMQIAARDRTHASLQGEILGATAMGIRNVLCVTGDSPVLAPQPRGRMDINDLDAIQMIWILRRMRDEGHYLDGRELKFPPKFFLGAAASPFASDPKFQALREQKKVNEGAQFFQTNLVYDMDRFEIWLNEIAKRNILDKVFIMVGITPLKSAKMTHYMTQVPGVYVPDALLKRMDDAEKGGPTAMQEEGVKIALEIIEKIKKLHGQGVHGLHIMPVGWENIVPRIVQEAGLMKPEAVMA